MKPLLRLNGYDVLLALAVLFLAVTLGFAAWTPTEGGRVWVEVSAGGQLLERFPLDQADRPRTYQGSGYTLRVSFSDGGVFVEEADCPTQDCVHTGVIHRSGQSIVCLPARIVIRLTGTQEDGVDAMIG